MSRAFYVLNAIDGDSSLDWQTQKSKTVRLLPFLALIYVSVYFGHSCNRLATSIDDSFYSQPLPPVVNIKFSLELA